jgi:hypothetical protein
MKVNFQNMEFSSKLLLWIMWFVHSAMVQTSVIIGFLAPLQASSIPKSTTSNLHEEVSNPERVEMRIEGLRRGCA